VEVEVIAGIDRHLVPQLVSLKLQRVRKVTYIATGHSERSKGHLPVGSAVSVGVAQILRQRPDGGHFETVTVGVGAGVIK